MIRPIVKVNLPGGHRGPFGGGWKYVVGIKATKREAIIELLVFSIRVKWRQPS